jgi:hypothetical protein
MKYWNFIRIPLLVGIMLWLFAGSTLAASKIDTIYFRNGDRMTGEVKSLENNYLRLSTDDAGTIQIEWNKVDSVKILNIMRILLQDGQVYYGSLQPAGEKYYCYIWSTMGDPRLTPLTDIVNLTPLEDRFLDRLKGTLSSGFSYTKANDLMQINLNGSLTYLANKNQVDLFYDGNFTRQDTLASNQHQNSTLSFKRLLRRNWFLVSNLGFESSSELRLDLRTSFGVGGGKHLIHSNRTTLLIAGGIQGNKEEATGQIQYNLEGLVTANYKVYIYESPEVSFNLSADVIPSLNDPGRIRTSVDSNLKWEIFNDFYLKWTFYHSFDSKPLSEGAAKYDWAITLLGVEYKL